MFSRHQRFEMEVTFSLIFKFILVLCAELCLANRYNVSLSELATCKEYRIESGYVYRNFFSIDGIENNRGDDEILRLKFYVMAPSNAHILLSPVDKATKSDRVYEIVVGAGKNTFSTIRPNIGGSQLTVKKQNGLLNGIDPTPIIVVQKKDGTIEVSIPTFAGPLLFYKDPKPLHIKYVSLSSFGTTSARWFYDCNGDKSAWLKMEPKNLTTLERLQEDLFTNYSIFSIPQGLSKVKIGVLVKGASFDVHKSIFQTRLELKLKWMDNKLRWDPAIYDNITALRSFEVNFWTPSLLIMNGAKASFTKFDPEFFGIISNNGSVEAYTKQQIIETWCKDPTGSNWPYDEHQCSIDFGIDGNELSFEYDFDDKLFAEKMSESVEWRLANISLSIKNMIRYNQQYGYGNETYSGATLNLSILRNLVFYRKIFHTPLVVSGVLILLSFQTRRFARGILNLIAFNLLLGVFILLTNHTPLCYVPNIVHIYEAYLGIACVSYILSIANRWLTDYPPFKNPPECVLKVLSSSTLRFIYRIQFTDAADYLSLHKDPWKQVGVILDSIMFTIFFTTFIVFSSKGFK